MSTLSRRAYAEMYGPTVGDRLRLGDTALWLEVEHDLTTYGEEVKFGGGYDNFRIKRYIAKYTINPAITHGIAHEVVCFA